MKLDVRPMRLAEARAFVAEHHRHHRPPRGHLFSAAATLDNQIVGIVIIGRPVSRNLDNGTTVEITRLCTNGARNACSFLYGLAARAAFTVGYRRAITYTLASECGTSLRAAGWRPVYRVPGRSWSCKSRPRDDNHPIVDKWLWERLAT